MAMKRYKFGEEAIALLLQWMRMMTGTISKDLLYNNIKQELLPSSESLRDTVRRVMPTIKDVVIPQIKNNKKIMIVAHGNSLRAIIKVLKEISDENIVTLIFQLALPMF